MMNGSITTLKTNHRSTVHREDGGNPIFSEMYRAQPQVLVNCTKVQPVCSVSYRFHCYLGDLWDDHWDLRPTINTYVTNCGTSKKEYWNIKMPFTLIFFSSTLKIRHCQGTTDPRHCNLTHSTPLAQSWGFNKHRNLNQSSVCFCLAKGEKNKEKLWQIHVIT